MTDFFCSMPASSSASVCSASSRRSVLKMLNSVSSAVNALPLSGVSSASPVPPSSKPAALTPPNASIASPSCSRSAVKSWSTCSDVENDAIAMRSAGDSFFST